tara:strand:+ start:33 stop:356 length:324 start_codon:yes stop_codon:yes gene_type:complete
MLTKTQIGVSMSSVASTAVVEMNTSPNLPGTSALLVVEYIGDATMDVKFEGSDDNSTFSDLWNPPNVNETGLAVNQISSTVTLPKYIKGTVTARTDGTASFHVMNAG